MMHWRPQDRQWIAPACWEECGALAPDLTAEAPVDRRLYLRHRCRIVTACRSLKSQSNTSYVATVLNVSQAGIGLRTARQYPAGMLLTVGLQNDNGSLFLLKTVRVRHVLADQAEWVLGCTFLKPLTDRELGQLV